MGTTKKSEWLLEGLDCAHCATKIEQGVAQLDGVALCHVNFATKTMQLETAAGKEVTSAAKALIHQLEPDVTVREKKRKESQQVFMLQGLSCAHCATNIEKETSQLPQVTASSVDFVARKLTIIGGTPSTERTEAIVSIVHRLKPEIKVIEDEGSAAQAQEKNHTKPLIMRILASSLLLGIATLLTLPESLTVALFIVAYLLIGGDVLLKAGRNIMRGHVFDENFLMAIATIGAFAIAQYPEGVAVMLFYQIGEFFQGIAVNRSRRSITALMDIRPDYANRKINEVIEKVPPEDLSIGETILVRPGEKVPLDGVIIEGRANVDTSALTGESVPQSVTVGDEILSGSINKDGVITVSVTKVYGESTVSKILELVQNASSKKAPTENLITKFAKYYTPFVVMAATALAFIPPLLIADATFSQWIYRALVFLVISCPCALMVSIPLGFFGGIGGASKKGILVKGSNYLEALNDVKYVVFDKTGTLTKGVFKVTRIVPEASYTKEQLLLYAALAEAHSAHPIALSIRKAYGHSIDQTRIKKYQEIAGQGISVHIDDCHVLAGNEKLMRSHQLSVPPVHEMGTLVYIAINHTFAGYLLISDEIKEDAKEAILALKKLGIKKVMMLTGDAKHVALAVGKRLGLDEVHAELLPHQKVEQLDQLFAQKSSKEKLIFVGDGINDTPVLARADIGIAMGGLGSDAAIEAADVVIMTDEPSKIATGLALAKRTRRIVYQNITLALLVKTIFLAFGAFGYATMWEAVFSDVGVTLLAVLNAMRVLRVDQVE
ncbi:heavy metal-transporting ATPase [Fictibacillus macauensis ZFHKF-1]|uniref:Heavy metal-transporting ATPase n=1 Tax=Fictibacillus macauensis ZFHKF-1 TaxID=1196324 RepID=I8ALI2_9BACL|nr:heavy metal translocating P-type ATPase [Fictibacillus macauensis]EIT86449.1 heavy metal-transporting ATPase [Fictibacillus macauensis ZFHKF-1]